MDKHQILCVFFVVDFILAFLGTVLKWLRRDISMTESVEKVVKAFQWTFFIAAVIIFLGLIIAS